MGTRSSQVTSQIIGDEYAGRVLSYVWNTGTLQYEVQNQAGASGGGAASIADGADVAQGAKADAAWDGIAASATLIAIQKYGGTKLEAIRALLAGTIAISAVALPLPTGAAQDATLTAGSQKAIARGGQKGTTNTNADITHTASGANHEGLDVVLYDAAGNLIDPRVQGTAAAVAGAWPVKVTDGTNTQAVKAASTAAVAADPAAVVALSPATGVPELRASTTVNSSTAAVNTALTATLAAAGAGLFHYITSIIVEKLYSVVGVAAGAGNVITTTGLGGLAFTTEQLASPAGTLQRVVDYRPTTPLKAAVANAASTVVCPQQLQTIWRITVTYFIAP